MAWYDESKRHSDAAKGRKTTRKERRTLNFTKSKWVIESSHDSVYDADEAVQELKDSGVEAKRVKGKEEGWDVLVHSDTQSDEGKAVAEGKSPIFDMEGQ